MASWREEEDMFDLLDSALEPPEDNSGVPLLAANVMKVNSKATAITAFRLWLEELDLRDAGNIRDTYFVHKSDGTHPGYFVVETESPFAIYKVSMDGEVTYS